MRVWGQLGIEGVEARWIKSVRCHVSGWVRQRRISIAVSQVKIRRPHQIDGSIFISQRRRDSNANISHIYFLFGN